MKKLIFTTLFLMLCAVFALAQTSGTNQSNPSTQQPGATSSSPSSSSGGQDTAAPSTSTSSTSQDQMGNKSQSSATTKSDNAGKEKTITGCLESAGSSGQYVIKHRNKEVTVVPSSAVSSEIASHVGEKVKLKGSWEQGSASNTTASNTGGNLPQSDQPGGTSGSSGMSKGDSGMSKGDKGGKEFRADAIEKVSGTCGGKDNSKSKSDNSGGTNPKPY
jgi:hypothetical protein